MHMNRQEAIDRANVELTAAINKWSDETTLWEDGHDLGYVGDNMCRLMAKAAVAVLESSADVQDYLRSDGQIT